MARLTLRKYLTHALVSTGNETEVGDGIRTSGVPRDDVFLSVSRLAPAVRVKRLTSALTDLAQTKWSGEPMGDPTMGPAASLRQSLQRMKVSYVDLYIIHTPRLVRNGSMRQRWTEMLELREAGLARNVGISNFSIEDLAELQDAIASSKVERPSDQCQSPRRCGSIRFFGEQPSRSSRLVRAR